MLYKSELIRLIQSEMVPGVGCTEPAAIGLAVSRTCSYLEDFPDSIQVIVSSNIFKNAYSVNIPGANRTGVEMAAALGALLTDKNNSMELFSGVTESLARQAEMMVDQRTVVFKVKMDSRFYIEVIAKSACSTCRTITLDRHDQMVYAEKDEKIMINQIDQCSCANVEKFDINRLKIRDIVELCKKIPLEEIQFLSKGIEMNQAVAKHGLASDFGIGVGKHVAQMAQEGTSTHDISTYVKAHVAAACDCRMGGAPYSAMTVLGSGNQGFCSILIPASAAEFLHASHEQTLRAVMISIAITIFIKYQVGRLSPVCGAGLAGAAGAAAIAWLLNGAEEQMEGAVQNVLGNLAGMVCDGAKAGCALKLCSCAGEAVAAAQLAVAGKCIQETDGLIGKTVEDTINNIAALSQSGMSNVDAEIISILSKKSKI